MRQRGVIAAVVAAVLLAGIGAVAAATQDRPQGGPPPGGAWRGPGGPMGGFGFGLPGLRELDLTDAQKEQIKGIMDSHRDEMQQVDEKTRAAQFALNSAADAGAAIDEGAVRAKSTELATAIADVTILRARVNAEIFNVLTAEQQQKLNDLRAQMQERMKNGPRRQRGR